MRLCVAFFNGWWMNFVNIGRRANMWGWIYRQSFISCLLMAFLCIERTKYQSENGFLKVIIVCFYWETELIELLLFDFVVIKSMDIRWCLSFHQVWHFCFVKKTISSVVSEIICLIKIDTDWETIDDRQTIDDKQTTDRGKRETYSFVS